MPPSFAENDFRDLRTGTIYDELHARPAVDIDCPMLVTHLGYTTDDHGAAGRACIVARRHRIIGLVRQCYAEFAVEPPADVAPCEAATEDAQFAAQLAVLARFKHQETLVRGDRTCIVQTHTEFLGVTFLLQHHNLSDADWSAIPDGIDAWRSKDFRPDIATHLRVERLDVDQPVAHGLGDVFNCSFRDGFLVGDVFRDLLASRVSDGAFAWTPFRPFIDGFNRILVRIADLSPARTGRLVQRLLEIDTYSFMALLGLDSARDQLRTLRQRQSDLGAILKSNGDDRNEQKVAYRRLSALSQVTAKDIAATRYRFYASRAYADVVWERVGQLQEEKVLGWSRIGYFLDRTFRPAVQTCEAALNFQNAISQGIQQAAELLGAGVSIDLEFEGKRIERRMLFLTIAILLLTGMAAVYYTSHVLHDWGLIGLPGGHGP